MSLFQEFYSNDIPKQTLVRWITDGRLPHTLLFEGESGLGKTHLARLAACGLLCSGESKPCGHCRSCNLILRDQHPDVRILSPKDEDKPYTVAALRQLVLDCYVRPNDGFAKVYILRDLDEMSEQGQNTLLKIVEEPPETVYFFLTCRSRSHVLPTILSRATILRLEPCSSELCLAAVKQRLPQVSEEEALRCVRLCGGNLGRCLQILSDPQLSQLSQKAQEAALLICSGSEFELLSLLRTFDRKREDFLLFLEELRQLFHGVLLQKVGAATQELLPEQQIRRISPLQSRQILAIIETVTAQVNQNVSVSLAGAQLCASLFQLLRA